MTDEEKAAKLAEEWFAGLATAEDALAIARGTPGTTAHWRERAETAEAERDHEIMLRKARDDERETLREQRDEARRDVGVFSEMHVALMDADRRAEAAEARVADISAMREDLADEIERQRDQLFKANVAVAALQNENRDLQARVRELEESLSNLLARIHRDGGHHTIAVGLDESAKDADGIVARLNLENDEMAQQLQRMREALEKVNHTALCLTWMAQPCNCGLATAREALAALPPKL